MKVTYFPNKISNKPSSLVLGSFEMIHNGHLDLIKEAKNFKDKITVMLIEDPKLLPKSSRNNLTDLNSRLQVLSNLGVDNAIVIKFTKDIENTEGKDFIKKMVEISNAKRLILGKDFSTGKFAKYKAQDISKDFETIIVDFRKINNTKISTSLFSEFLEMGEVDLINQNAPSPYQVKLNFNSNGVVFKNEYAKIHSGIYASTAVINDIRYWSLLHVDQNQKLKIQIPDLLLKNSPFEATVEIYKLVRIIISSKEDQIKDEDKDIVASYLHAL